VSVRAWELQQLLSVFDSELKMTSYFKYSVDSDGVCFIVIDQPNSAANVMDQKFIDGFKESVNKAIADPVVKGVVISSAKTSFVAGADLKVMEASLYEKKDPEDFFNKCFDFSSYLRKIETSGKTFVAAIDGAALGGGFEIALACHARIVSDKKGVVVGLPEVGVGLLPGGGGTQRFLRMLGVEKSLPLLLQGSQLNAKKALEIGLVTQVVSSEDLLKVAKQWVLDHPAEKQPWDREKYQIPGGSSPMLPNIAQFFVGTNASLQAATQHNLPAPRAILSCIYEGMQLPMDTALRVECKYFVKLNLDPVSGNMIRTIFLNKSEADKLSRRPKDVEKKKHEKIGVIGAGLMGAGVAYVAAQSGIEVFLLDRDIAAAEKGKNYAENKMKRDLEKGRIKEEKMVEILSRIHPTTDYANLSQVSLVVEAVFEDREVKAEVYKKAAEHLRKDAVMASNTSALPISGLAKTYVDPTQFIGLHFFSPVERMPLVEIVKGEKTSQVALAHAMDFVGQLRKTPILVNDSRGFFTSRFFGAMINEGVTMVSEGVLPALIEQAAKSAGMAIGPLAVSDEVGLDLANHAAKQAQKDLGPDHRPGSSVSVITTLVEKHERFGRKNGKGFYEYAVDGSKSIWPGLNTIWKIKDEAAQPSLQSVKERLLFAQLVDAAKCFAEKVIDHPADGDVGACLGVGFPIYLGGPYSMMDTLGLDHVIERCDQLTKEFGVERFGVPDSLRAMAKNKQTFYGPTSVLLTK